ncbi:MAG TPA: serine hydrolase domain-containing protein [Bryobacteraceae bacterium]
MTRRCCLVRAALCAAISAACASTLAAQAPSAHGTQIAAARQAVKELIAAKQIPGVSIAVASRGAIVWSEGFGLADVEQSVAATPQTRFRLGSVSKVLTSAGLARLVENGALNLDAPVQQYVPDFPQKAWPITVRQLAGHVAGIRHYEEKDFTGPLQGAPHFASTAAGLAIFRNDPLLFEPGTAYAYSSYGWNLIGAAMEGASHEDFLKYMQRAVFEPLGLRSITADHVDAIIPYRTAFYARDANRNLTHAPYVDNSYKWPSGGFLSNAEDLVRFASALLQPGYLRQETLALLFTSQKLKSGKDTGVGLAWRIGVDSTGKRVYHHGGTIEGGRAMVMVYPDSQVAVAMLANILAEFGEKDAQTIGRIFIDPPGNSRN